MTTTDRLTLCPICGNSGSAPEFLAAHTCVDVVGDSVAEHVRTVAFECAATRAALTRLPHADVMGTRDYDRAVWYAWGRMDAGDAAPIPGDLANSAHYFGIAYATAHALLTRGDVVGAPGLVSAWYAFNATHARRVTN